jgi:hypothetical protein
MAATWATDGSNPNTLLRSVIRHGDEPKQDLLANTLRLVEAVRSGKYVFLNPDCSKIAGFVREYVDETDEPPTADIIRNYFERVGVDGMTTVDKLGDISSCHFHAVNPFKHYLTAEIESQRKVTAISLMEAGKKIVESGITKKLGNRTINFKGPEDALKYVTQGFSDLLQDDSKARSKIWNDSAAVINDYNEAKARPLGLRCGLGPIDDCFSGVRPGEMWTHAAFTGHLKSTLAANVAYYTTMIDGRGVLYVSLEMTIEQIRRSLYVIHSASNFEKWGRPGLNYGQVREGKLNPQDEAYLAEVARDAEASAKGTLTVWSPPKKVGIAEIMVQAEAINRRDPLGLVVIDHSGLVKPATQFRNDPLASANSVFVDAKQAALGFAGGAGVPVLILHQINREGSRTASKEGGRLTLAHLSNANEAERSSDYVTTSWIDDDLRARNRTRITCLKNREGGPFSDFEASVTFPSRKISYTGHEDGMTNPSEEEFRTLLDGV